jgi:phage terminase small subunit
MGRQPEEPNYGLKEKDFLFLQEYMANEFNGTAAASNLLRTTKMKQAIKEELHCIAGSYEISKNSVLRELAILGFSDIRDFVDFAGDTVQLKSSDEIGANAKAIKEITITPVRMIDSEGESFTGNKVNLKLYDKLKPLDLLGKHMQMFETDKAEIEINDNKIVIERKVIKSKEDRKDE